MKLKRGAFLLLLTLWAAFATAPDASAAAVTYQDAAWNETTKAVDFTVKTCDDYTAVTSDSTAWGAGWYTHEH